MFEGLSMVDELKKPQFRFENAVDLFPEDQQEQAREFSEIFQEYRKAVSEGARIGDSTAYDLVSEFCNKNTKDTLDDCKLFHLFSGSGMSRDMWMMLPMDTLGSDWKNFIETKIVPLISKEEKPEIEKKEAA